MIKNITVHTDEHADGFIENSTRGLYRMNDFVFGGTMLLPAIRKEFHSANTLEVTAATNGSKGGDAGHGCRTMIRFNDLAGTAIKARVIPESINGNGGVELLLAGDCELWTVIEGLRFAADALERLDKEASRQDEII